MTYIHFLNGTIIFKITKPIISKIMIEGDNIYEYPCKDKCCKLKISPYKYLPFPPNSFSPRSKYKAGAFIYDPVSNKILIIQSRGIFWGPPKGSLDEGEDTKTCAIREVQEETGLNIFPEELTRYIRIRNRAIYYYIEMPERPVNIQNHIPGNDANGIGWIKVECLLQMISAGKIRINQHLRYLIDKIIIEKVFSKAEER